MKSVQDHAAKSFTCACCKRVRPKSQREKGRNRCRDRAACAQATAEWFGRTRFPELVSVRS